MLKCEVCGKEFEKKNTRGRPPKICYSCKGKVEERHKQNREAREKAGDNGLTVVPVFEKISSPENLSRGDLVYALPTFTEKDIIRRRFAMEYKVLSIDGLMVEVVRNIKSSYKQYPVEVDFSRLYQKSGVEYLDIGSDNVIMETEGIDE
jgi:hypothetical protein